ncbi:MAG: AI-2E family transporter, partial [Angustibacter sp.]
MIRNRVSSILSSLARTPAEPKSQPDEDAPAPAPGAHSHTETREVHPIATITGGYGAPGAPLNLNSAFMLGFLGALGAFLAWGLVSIVQQVSSVLTLIVVAMFLALGLDPVVQAIARRGLSRRKAVSLVFVMVIALFTGATAVLVPPVVTEAAQLATEAPRYLENLLNSRLIRDLNADYGIISKGQQELQQRITDQSLWTSLFGGVWGAGRAVASGFFSAFTVLILTLYFLASLSSVKSALYGLVPRSRRKRVVQLSEEVSRRVGGYFLGQLAVASINAILSYVLMLILDLPFAAVLAVAVGLLGLLPMVGATLGAVLVTVVAFFSSGVDAAIVAGYYLIYQQVENYVIAPAI